MEGNVCAGDTTDEHVRLIGIDVVLRRDVAQTTATLIGDLETGTARDVERVLADELGAMPAHFEVSLEGLEFLDSSGLRVFIVLHHNAQRLGVPLTFVRPRGTVRRTLEFAKAIDYLGIVD